jgi:hypothetical protein
MGTQIYRSQQCIAVERTQVLVLGNELCNPSGPWFSHVDKESLIYLSDCDKNLLRFSQAQ